MGEIKKIELTKIEGFQSSRTPAAPPSMHSGNKKFVKKILFGFVGFLIIIGVLGFLITAPVQKVYVSAQKTQTQAKVAWDAIKKQDLELAATELGKTRVSLKDTQKELQAVSYLRFIPIVSWYYNDADHMVKAGFGGLDAGMVFIDSVRPYSDVLGLKGKGNFVQQSAEDRIRIAVMTMGKITPRIDDISKSLATVDKEISQVNPNHYPSFLGGKKIHEQLSAVQTVAKEGVGMVEQARPLIKILPSLLGEDKQKKYLVLFQNDKELRPTGGFLTAYAIFSIDKGAIHVEKSDDMYTLDKSLRVRGKAPEIIMKYLPKVTTFNLRDTNLSPDYIESMKTFNKLYNDATGKVAVDGIIALDTHVLVKTIKILDDEVWADGVEFTTKTDKRCDCPQVVYQLESMTDQPLSLDLRVTSLESAQAHRKDIIGTLLYFIMQKSFKSSPKKYWGPLVQEMISEVNQKHILFYLFDEDAQSGVEALNAAGRIKTFEGDYLHINEANFGGAKANLFTSESVEQNYEVGGDGSITKTVTINYKNPFPPSNCDLEKGGLCLNAPLRYFVRLYAPKGSQLVTSSGSEVKVETKEDLGKTVFEGFLVIRPLGKATYTLKYRLPFKVKGNLPVLIQKQPGRDADVYTTKVNGRKVDEAPLLTDKELKLSL